MDGSGYMVGVTSLLAAGAAEGPIKGGADYRLSFLGLMVYFAFVIAIVLVLLAYAKKGITARFFTNPVTQRLEQLYFFVENLCVGIIGAHGRKYIPMVMTFWLVIFIGNLVSLFSPLTVTGDFSFNLAMALIAVFYVQYEGVRASGFLGHLSHFAGPKLGWGFVWLNVIIFPVELISEMMKNLSLSLRLAGNIDGGRLATEAMNTLGKHIGGTDLSIPIGAFLLPVKLLTCVVQALIFNLLFCVYLSLVTHHEHEGDEEGIDEHDLNHSPAHAH